MFQTRTFRPRTFRTGLFSGLDVSDRFLCQLDIMSSLCGIGVRVNNFSSKTTRPRDMLRHTLSIEDEKLFKACKSVCSSVC